MGGVRDLVGGLLSASLELGRTEKRSQIGAVRTVIFRLWAGVCREEGKVTEEKALG